MKDETKKNTLAYLLNKHNANFISTIDDKIVKTHMKGMKYNGEIELRKGQKYKYRIKDKIKEGIIK